MGTKPLHSLTLEAELLTKIVNRLELIEVKLDMALRAPAASKPAKAVSSPSVSNGAQAGLAQS